MDGRLAEAFGRLPKTPYEVKPLEEYREKDAPAAYYLPPAIDGSRAGIFYANTRDPPSWPRTTSAWASQERRILTRTRPPGGRASLLRWRQP